MEINRDSYLDQLIEQKHNGLVKVITNLRRVGKSFFLFNLFSTGRGQAPRSACSTGLFAILPKAEGLGHRHIVVAEVHPRDSGSVVLGFA